MTQESQSAKEETSSREWAVWLHLSIYLGVAFPMLGWAAPLIIWQARKDLDPVLDEHGRHAANFVITLLVFVMIWIPMLMLLLLVVEWATSWQVPGSLLLLPLFVLFVWAFTLPAIAAAKASGGTAWRYPLSFQIL